MLYFIEAAAFSVMFFILAGESKKTAFLLPLPIAFISIICDPLLFSIGFIWTASNLFESIFINGIVFIGAMLGACSKCLKMRIQG